MEADVRPCGTPRPALRDPGWECTGQGLIVVWTAKIGLLGLPVVLPARALDVIDPESWWDTPVQPFTGGDHLHLFVPRRPTTFGVNASIFYDDPVVRGWVNLDTGMKGMLA